MATKKVTKATKKTSEVAKPTKPSKLEMKQADAALKWKIAFFIAIVAVGILAIAMAIDNSGTNNPKKDVNVNLGAGEILIEEYSDFQCPYCERFYSGAYKDMKNDPLYKDGKIKFVFKHFPLSIHKDAQKASEASECARDQDMFTEYHDKLFENQNALTVPDLKRYAKDLGLNTNTFDSCLDSGEKYSIVQADFNEGRAKGVSGTPTIYVNGKQFVGAQAWTTLKASLGEGSVPNTEPTPTATPDAEFEVIILNDNTCTVCDGAALSNGLSPSFPSAKFRTLDINSGEGKTLKDSLNLEFVPAVLFATDVEKSNNFAQLSQALQQVGDYYLLNPQINGYPTIKILKNLDLGTDAVLGDPNAPLTIYEWSDFECPFCGKFYTETLPTLITDYVDTGKVNMVFMHFPLSFHPQAKPSALASECANDQGKFWEYHDLLFENQASLSADNYVKWATDLGLNTQTFNECMSSGKYNSLIDEEFSLGQEYYITGTPGFIVGNIKLSGALPADVFKQVIDSQLAE